MKRKIILGLSLFMSLAIVGGGFVALNGVAETNDPVEVGAAITYTYSLRGSRTNDDWATDIVSCEDTGSGGSFTVELTEGEQIKIVITVSGDESWNYWPSYSECISDSLSAYFSDSGGNYLVNATGEYTFKFDAGWGKYNDKHYGLAITPPDVETRSVTFSRLFGTEGDYLDDATKSIVVGSTTPTYADFTPDWVYGFTFDGFYSDASCETSIPLTTEVTADVTSGVWARYLPAEGAVTYTFDYSAGMSTVWNSSYRLAYRYWNEDGSAVTWPGVYVGGSPNGTFTFTVASDATGFQIVACDAYGNSKGETNAATIAPATDTIFMRGIKDGGTADNYGYYKVDAFTPDADYMTIYNALQGVADVCSSSAAGSAVTDTITDAWTSIAGATGTEHLAHITGITARVDSTGNRVDGLAGLVSVYDFCVNKYSLENPLGRTVAEASAYRFLGNEENSHFVEIIAVVAIAGIIVGGFFFLRKRKGENA